jgi:RNA polymerase-binding transcription factor
MPDAVLISTGLADREGTGGVGRLDTAAARQRLEEVRDELDHSIAVLNGAHQEHPLAADYPDPADAGTNLAETDRAQAILAAAKARRVLVLEALGRLEAGGYGSCVDCGKGVPDGRLEAKPEAARCLACQAKRDRARR